MPIANPLSPMGVASVDPVTGAPGASSAVTYTAIATNGTTTVKGSPGVYYGSYLTVLGTAPGIAILDGTATIAANALPAAIGTLVSPLPAALGLGS